MSHPGNLRIIMQDYSSLHVAVIICATMVNTQKHTHIQTHKHRHGDRQIWPAILLAQPAALKWLRIREKKM